MWSVPKIDVLTYVDHEENRFFDIKKYELNLLFYNEMRRYQYLANYGAGNTIINFIRTYSYILIFYYVHMRKNRLLEFHSIVITDYRDISMIFSPVLCS